MQRDDPYEHRPASDASSYEKVEEEEEEEDTLLGSESWVPPSLTRGASDEEDYYIVLGVTREATENEIRDAYRTLSRQYHPDKHPTMPEVATRRFAIIQHAADILLDPGRRAVYDTHGEQGLRAGVSLAKWSSPEAFRREFERLARERLETDVEGLIRSRGDLEVQLDLSGLIDPYTWYVGEDEEEEYDGVSLPSWSDRWERLEEAVEVRQMTLRHSHEIPINEANSLVISGHSISQNGIGASNAKLTWKRSALPIPGLSGELSASLLKPRLLRGKLQYQHSDQMAATLNAHTNTPWSPPKLAATVIRRVGIHSHGHCTFFTGDYSLGPWGSLAPAQRQPSSLNMGVAYIPPGRAYQYYSTVQAGRAESFVSARVARPLAHGVTASAEVKLSTAGVFTSIGTETKLSKAWTLGWFGQCGSLVGTCLSLRLSRLGQGLSIPIILSPDVAPSTFIMSLAIPSILMTGAEHLILGPRRVLRRKERIQEARAVQRETLERQRIEALETQDLMGAATARRQKQEADAQGLFVFASYYGEAAKVREIHALIQDSSRQGKTLASIIESISLDAAFLMDATLPIQALVQDSRILLSDGSSKTTIPGMYDPCFGDKKSLLLVYLFRGEEHMVIIHDKSSLTCPLRSHRLSKEAIQA